MRIIDADGLIKHIQTTYCKDCKDCNKDKDLFHCRTEQIIGDIQYAPTVDPWHYPSRGEYPPKEQEYFVAFKAFKEIYYDVRVLNPELNNLWLGIGEQIYAWQYITPPKD